MSPAELIDAIRSRRARVGVIGLGYVGLPLVRAFAQAGYKVVGFDIDEHKVELLAAGTSYIRTVPAELIRQLVSGGRFEPTSDFSRLTHIDAILICVPTPLGDAREPDLSAVTYTADTIAKFLRPGQLVVLESTTYPGTTEEVLAPRLEQSGLKAGADFFLAFSPEREDPGNPQHTVSNIPKLVGGINTASTQAAVELYTPVVPAVVPVSSPRVAEAAKLLENTYRAVNIALVNELKMLFDRMGINIWEVIEAAKTKPFGFQAFYPGPGLGGHCVPIDPFYLSWIARKYGLNTKFIELAGEVNTRMPDYVVERVAEYLNERAQPLRGSKILVLGVAYKADVDDPRESPAFVIIEKLQAKGATVAYNDPYIPRLPRMRKHKLEMASVPLTEEMLASQDCVIIVTAHSCYDWDWIVKHSKLVVDTRNATKRVREHRDRIRFA